MLESICSVPLRGELGRQQQGWCLDTACPRRDLSSVLCLCWCSAKRGGNIEWTGGVPSLLWWLCSPPSHWRIIVVVVLSHSALCNSSTPQLHQLWCFLWGLLLHKSSQRGSTTSSISTVVRQHTDFRCPGPLEKPLLFSELGTSFTSPIWLWQTRL